MGQHAKELNRLVSIRLEHFDVQAQVYLAIAEHAVAQL